MNMIKLRLFGLYADHRARCTSSSIMQTEVQIFCVLNMSVGLQNNCAWQLLGSSVPQTLDTKVVHGSQMLLAFSGSYSDYRQVC